MALAITRGAFVLTAHDPTGRHLILRRWHSRPTTETLYVSLKDCGPLAASRRRDVRSRLYSRWLAPQMVPARADRHPTGPRRARRPHSRGPAARCPAPCGTGHPPVLAAARAVRRLPERYDSLVSSPGLKR